MKYDLYWNNTGLIFFLLPVITLLYLCHTPSSFDKAKCFHKISFIFIKFLRDRLGRFKFLFHYALGSWDLESVALIPHIGLGHSKLPSYLVATRRLGEKTQKFNFYEGRNIQQNSIKASFINCLFVIIWLEADLKLLFSFFVDIVLWGCFFGHAEWLVGS